MRKRILTLSLAFLATNAAADQTAGAAFLQINPSATAYALGQSHAVSALGAQALGANVANLGLMTQRFDVVTSYAALMDGAAYEHIGAAFAPQSQVLGLDAVGFSVTRLQDGGYQGADAQGNVTGASYGVSDMAITAGGSARIGSDLRLGLAGKVIQSSLANYSSNLAPAADLGATYTFRGFS